MAAFNPTPKTEFPLANRIPDGASCKQIPGKFKRGTDPVPPVVRHCEEFFSVNAAPALNRKRDDIEKNEDATSKDQKRRRSKLKIETWLTDTSTENSVTSRNIR